MNETDTLSRDLKIILTRSYLIYKTIPWSFAKHLSTLVKTKRFSLAYMFPESKTYLGLTHFSNS